MTESEICQTRIHLPQVQLSAFFPLVTVIMHIWACEECSCTTSKLFKNVKSAKEAGPQQTALGYQFHPPVPLVSLGAFFIPVWSQHNSWLRVSHGHQDSKSTHWKSQNDWGKMWARKNLRAKNWTLQNSKTNFFSHQPSSFCQSLLSDWVWPNIHHYQQSAEEDGWAWRSPSGTLRM